MLLKARLSAFISGAAIAGAFAVFKLRQDLLDSQEVLLDQVRQASINGGFERLRAAPTDALPAELLHLDVQHAGTVPCMPDFFGGSGRHNLLLFLCHASTRTAYFDANALCWAIHPRPLQLQRVRGRSVSCLTVVS